MATTLRKQSYIGAAIGTMIEYYDYALFAIFLPLIATQFFPGKDAYEALSNGYYILMISMIGRPFGGAIFGHIGDMIGRPRALLLSMYGIAITTFIIGITPTYQSIGIWAIVIIVISKFFQLACFGGEYNGAGIYVVEHSKPNQEAFSGSALAAIMTSGSIFASLFGVLLTMDYMPSWSWRIAFFVGGLIGVFGVLYRKKLHESPQFKPADKKEHSLKNLVKLFPRQIIAGAFIGGFITIPFTTVLTFVNPVLMTKGFMTAHQLMWLQTLMIAIGVIVILITGKLSDHFSPRKVMLFGALSLTLFSYPLLLLIDQHSFFLLIFSSILFVTINDIILGPSNAFLKSIFPPEFRYRGSSLGFTLGMTILGGLTSPIENALYHATGSFAAASLWLIFIGIGSYWSISKASDDKSYTIDSLEQPLTNNSKFRLKKA